MRFGSFVFDYIIYILIIFTIYCLFNYLNILNYLGKIFNQKLFLALNLFFSYITFFVLRWSYYIFFETFFNGKTPGKILLRLRVIHYQGKFLDIQAIILRNFIRIVDQDLTFFIPIPALICMMINKDSRRIGDLVANTVVIKEDKLLITPPDFNITSSIIEKQKAEEKVLIKKLSENDLYILRKFLNSFNTFPEEKRIRLSEQMAKTIKNKLNDTEEYTDPEQYLRTIYLRHKDEY